MSTPRPIQVYIDQNILGLVRNGSISIGPRDAVVWVYSEHFKEISRGHTTSFLSVLRHLRAQQIELVLNENWQIADKMVLHEYSCPFDRYREYLKSVGEVPFADKAQAFLIGIAARCMGAENLVELRGLSEAACDALTQDIPGLSEKVQATMAGLPEKLNGARSLKSLRAALAVNQGRAGDVVPTEAIDHIWSLLERRHGGTLTKDQFFGIEELEQRRPTYLGIVACHIILNVVGFRADRHLDRPNAIPAILSDGSHIGHAAFCDLLLSGDRRMCDKASAIYAHLGIATHVECLRLKPPLPGRAA